MKFEEALKAMREGKQARLKGLSRTYFIIDGILRFLNDNDEFLFLGHLDCNQIMSEDWEIVDD